MLAAASISLLALSQQADAAVTYLVAQDGLNVNIYTTGSIDLGTQTNISNGVAHGVGPTAIWNFNTSASGARSTGGTWENDIPTLAGATFAADSWSGNIFGVSINGPRTVTALYTNRGVSGTTYTPTTNWVFNDETIATMFGTNLDSGPVLLWTAATGGETVSIELVPEPSSAALLGLGGLALILRRRK